MKSPAQATRILPCQALFGMERGDQIVAHIEEVTGQPCPCKRGMMCPFVGPVEEAPLRPAM